MRRKSSFSSVSGLRILVCVCGGGVSYLFCYPEESYVLQAHGLKGQREVTSDEEIGAFFRK